MIACGSREYEIAPCAVACGGALRRRFRRTQLQKSKSHLRTALAKIALATSRESRRTRSVRRLAAASPVRSVSSKLLPLTVFNAPKFPETF
jgi:hypothetical protein